MAPKSIHPKRKLTSPSPQHSTSKKLRSNLPPSNNNNNINQPSISVSEISCTTTTTTANSVSVTGKRNDAAKWNINIVIAGEGEASENCSCVESSSVADADAESKLKRDVLACSENLSEDEDEYGEDYTSSSATLSEIDDSLSDSGSEFSLPGDSTTAPRFVTLYRQYSEQLTRLNGVVASVVDDDDDEFADDEFAYWRFEEGEDEESYQRLRRRERKRSLKMEDYVSEYAVKSEYGVLIHKQRLLMVDWIIEASDTKELRGETTFLAVRLLDRFLSKGFFKNGRNLEILGIACLTLATRIEEKQPYNCILQKVFQVEDNVYGRTEVVAMERLIQEQLKFQCFSPTTYNFLWFYLKAAAADEAMEDLAEQLADLAMYDHRHLQFWPSSVAAGIVMLVSLVAKRDKSCLRVMKAHLRTSFDDLPECIKTLEWLVKYAS